MSANGEPSSAVSEKDPRFGSGPWTGYWAQCASGGITLGWMDLHLRFAAGALTGTGRDLLGLFSLRGRYDTASGACFIRKRYTSHEVFYRGFSDGRGIRGRWEIPPQLSGPFSIWPGCAGRGEEAETAVEEPVGAETWIPLAIPDLLGPSAAEPHFSQGWTLAEIGQKSAARQTTTGHRRPDCTLQIQIASGIQMKARE